MNRVICYGYVEEEQSVAPHPRTVALLWYFLVFSIRIKDSSVMQRKQFGKFVMEKGPVKSAKAANLKLLETHPPQQYAKTFLNKSKNNYIDLIH